MFPELSIWLKLILAFAVSLVISYLMTPPVKGFAEHVGAIDVPKDDRRVHDHPIPRMGGLAIFLGFVLSLLIFVPMDIKVMGLLLGALIIAVVGGAELGLEPAYEEGVSAVFTINRLPMDLKESAKYSAVNLDFVMDNILRILKK